MSTEHNPFVVSQLRPETANGNSGQVYQLNMNSVTPTRITGADDLGMPIEERIPICYSREFVGLDGCVKSVPLRTAAVYSQEPEAQRYEQVVVADIIRAGQLPLDACPYTNAFSHIRRGPLVKVPPGVEACEGKAGGCEHMHVVIKARKAAALVKHNAEQAKIESLRSEDVSRMMEGITQGVGAAIANHLAANREHLKSGKGEQLKPSGG